jgi:peroxiredoxin Q/BCP
LGVSGCYAKKKGSMKKAEIGAPAPEFSLPGTDDKNHRPSEMRGKKLVIYFYPKDGTPGCTKEACSIQSGYKDLEKAGIVVWGISYDSIKSHKKFKEENHLNFLLLSDANKEAAALYGAKRALLPIPERYTYLIDEKGILIKILKDVNVADHAHEIINAFNEMNQK